MDFKNLRINEIHSVTRYKSTSNRWITRNRKNHIIGIQSHGKAIHYFKSTEFTLSENCIYFLNQRDDYTVKVVEPCESFSIHFTTYENITTDSFCVPVSNQTPFLSILEKSEVAQYTNNNLLLLSLAYQFCAEIERIRNKKYLPNDTRMIVAKEYIDIHFKEHDCLKSAIEGSGISARRFGELFRNMYNITPNKYVTLCKIEYAKSLLSVGYYSITEISDLCNFSDVYYFSNVFKNCVGVSPSRYIKE